MGHRANLVLVEKDKVNIYYSKWDGRNASKILSQGLRFCENHFKKYDEDGWLMDNTWAEGGILIDKNKNTILFFEIEFLETGGLKRKFIEYLIQNIWEKWKIEWAFRGNVDFAEYLNIMDSRILADGCIPNFPKIKDLKELIIEEEHQECAGKSLITIIHKNTSKDYILFGFGREINSCIGEGEELKDNLPSKLEIYDPGNINDLEIDDVLIVDYDNKNLYIYWNYEVDDRHINKVREIWKGWYCERQTKGVQFNFEYTNRNEKYRKITQQEFNEYVKTWKLLDY